MQILKLLNYGFNNDGVSGGTRVPRLIRDEVDFDENRIVTRQRAFVIYQVKRFENWGMTALAFDNCIRVPPKLGI